MTAKMLKLPAIPWIEPAINGIRLGQLIHPTTNLATLNKASSNGCIGLRESDAWYVYYYAPLGTKVVFRYDLQVKDENGNVIQLDNIYPGFEKIKIRNEAFTSAAEKIASDSLPYVIAGLLIRDKLCQSNHTNSCSSHIYRATDPVPKKYATLILASVTLKFLQQHYNPYSTT